MKKPEICRIQAFFHCKNCMNGKLAVGYTDDGHIQVFCEDCDKEVWSN